MSRDVVKAQAKPAKGFLYSHALRVVYERPDGIWVHKTLCERAFTLAERREHTDKEGSVHVLPGDAPCVDCLLRMRRLVDAIMGDIPTTMRKP